MIRVILQVFCAIFSAFMEALSISNEITNAGSPLLGLFCLLPLYIAVYRAKSYRESFYIMGLQILVTHLFSSYWLANFHGFAVFTLGASALGTAIEGALMGIIMHAYPASLTETQKMAECSGLNKTGATKRMLWFSAVWTLYEYIKSTGALGYPWGTLFMSSYALKPVIQIADLTGVWGITLLFALSSSLAAEAVTSITEHRTVRTEAKSLALVFAAVFAYGTVQYFMPRIPEKKLNTVIVQQNIDPWEGGEQKSIEISKKLTLEGIKSFSDRGLETDLVLWSEGVLSKTFPGARFRYETFPQDESLSDFIKKTDTPFIIGGTTTFDREKHKYANSAILFDSDGKYSGYYSKIQLVPFAEKIPYSDNPLMEKFMKDVVGMYSGLTSGFQYVLFRVPIKENKNTPAPFSYARPEESLIELDKNGKSNSKKTKEYTVNEAENPKNFVSFTTPICFEDSFPSVSGRLHNMGSEVFMNITNDSWSKTDSAEYQHFIIASFLSVEYRTTLVRCTNSGYSAVVAPNGKIIADLPLFEEASVGFSVPIYKYTKTLYSVAGDWLVYIAAAAVLLYLAWSAAKNVFEQKKISLPHFVQITVTIGKKDNKK